MGHMKYYSRNDKSLGFDKHVHILYYSQCQGILILLSNMKKPNRLESKRVETKSISIAYLK